MRNSNFFGECAILVSRVSTPIQALSPDCSPQLMDLRRFAKDCGYSKFKEFGTTESGFLKEDDKQGWNLITAFIKEHQSYRTIICTEISRLGRDEEILMHIKNFLITNKIQLIIKDINFELFNRFGETDPSKEIIFSMYASIAKTEMQQKKERFKRALTEYKRLGYSIGGKVLFGYNRVCDGKLRKKNTYVINEDEAKQIRTIYDWYLHGIDGDLTQASIAKITFECRAKGFSEYLWSKRNVNKCLKEKAYTGSKITANKRKNAAYWNYKDTSAPKYVVGNSYECSYPRIIQDTIFESVQAKLCKKGTHIDKSNKHTTILSKIIICPECGGFYIGDYRVSGKYMKHNYRCSHAKGKLIRKCHNTKTISMIMLDSIVWAFIKEKVRDITNRMKQAKSDINIKEKEEEIVRLTKSIEEFDDRIETESIIFSTKMRYSQDKVRVKDEYEKSVEKITTERKQVERIINEKKRILKKIMDESTNQDLEEQITQNINLIETNKEEMYKFVHLLIKSVVPLLTDTRYSIIQIISFENIEDVFDYGYQDKNGLPYIAGEKHDNIFYICLDKRNTNNIKSRLIEDNLIEYDKTENKFKIGNEYFSIEDIFSINLECDNPTQFHTLQRSVKDFSFNKLSFYNEDI